MDTTTSDNKNLIKLSYPPTIASSAQSTEEKSLNQQQNVQNPHITEHIAFSPNVGIHPYPIIQDNLESSTGQSGEAKYDIGDDEFKNFDFSAPTIRKAFIRKVYSIVTVQLLVTTGFIALFLLHEPTRLYVHHNLWVIYGSLAMYLVSYISIICFEELRRRTPYNFIFLGIFTVCFSILIGVGTSMSSVEEVLIAAGVTIAVTVALTIFAFQTKWDFTMMGGFLVCSCVVLLIFGILAIAMRSPSLRLLYAAFAVLLFSFFLIYDTQLMMGGNYKYTISPEEYVFAALNIYIDIIVIFRNILRIMR